MKTWGLWYGGSSYSAPDVERDTEEFDSIRHAKDAFDSRYSGDPYYPAVDDTSEMWLFFSDPREMSDVYPDRVLKFGPRGGIHTEPA